MLLLTRTTALFALLSTVIADKPCRHSKQSCLSYPVKDPDVCDVFNKAKDTGINVDCYADYVAPKNSASGSNFMNFVSQLAFPGFNIKPNGKSKDYGTALSDRLKVAFQSSDDVNALWAAGGICGGLQKSRSGKADDNLSAVQMQGWTSKYTVERTGQTLEGWNGNFWLGQGDRGSSTWNDPLDPFLKCVAAALSAVSCGVELKFWDPDRKMYSADANCYKRNSFY